MEWIVDDGEEVEDLFKGVECVKYQSRRENIEKEILCRKKKGEIIVYMDDDDYYRLIDHAVID